MPNIFLNFCGVYLKFAAFLDSFGDVASWQTVATSRSGCFSSSSSEWLCPMSVMSFLLLHLFVLVSWQCSCDCEAAADLIISHSLSFRLLCTFCSVVRRSRATFSLSRKYHLPSPAAEGSSFCWLECEISACFMHF